MKPNHYADVKNDPISVAEDWFTEEEVRGFFKVNILKYLERMDKKGELVRDLEKLEDYVRMLRESITKPTRKPLFKIYDEDI